MKTTTYEVVLLPVGYALKALFWLLGFTIKVSVHTAERACGSDTAYDALVEKVAKLQNPPS